MSSGSGCDTTGCTDNRQMLGQHELVKEELKLGNTNNYFSLNFDSVDLCLPLPDCHQEEQPSNSNHASVNRKARIASESSTIYDTCSSSSSTASNPASNNFTHSNDGTKCLSDHIIDYKPTIGSPLLPDINNTTSCNQYSYLNTNGHSTYIVDDNNNSSQAQQSPVLNQVPVVAGPKPVKAKKRSGGKSNPSNEILGDGINLQPILEPYYTMVYTCMHPHCGIETSTKDELLLHFKEKHRIVQEIDPDSIPCKMGKLSYKCIYDRQKCGKKLENVNKIASHICKTHLNKTVMKLLNSSSSGTGNDNQENQEDASAQIVEKTFSFSNILICSYSECLWSFQFEKALKLHKLKHKQQFDQSNSNTTSPTTITAEPEKSHHCDVCSAKFSRPSHLKSHMKSHIGFKCDYCVEVFPKHSQLLSHVFEAHKQTDKIYKCHYESCNKSYLCKMYLSSHITKSHLKPATSEAGRQCTRCNLKFTSACLKRQHDEIKHGHVTPATVAQPGNATAAPVKVYRCEYGTCGKEFGTVSKLNRHSLTHVKVKSFRCSFENCSAEFSRQDHLMNHVKFHDDQKLYECDFPGCKSSFKYQNNLTTHKKLHLSKSNTSILTSDLSDPLSPQTKQTAQRKNIYQEFKPIIQLNSDDENTNASTGTTYIDLMHTGNSNSEPPQSFISKDLCQQQQQLSHIEQQVEFKCSYCLYKFDSQEVLNIHLKSHFDVNKANEKLNDYLMAERQRNLIKYDIDLVEAPLIETDFMLKSDPSKINNNIDCQSDLMFCSVVHQPDQFNVQSDPSPPPPQYNHVININSDDEESVMCSVVLENLSGSARTDYKSNHIYIEKYKSKRKNAENLQNTQNKRIKVSDSTDQDCNDKPITPESPTSSIVFSPTLSVASTTVQTASKKSRSSTNSSSRTTPKKLSTNSSINRKQKLKLQKSTSMGFQCDLSSLQESLISQTSL